MTVDEPARRGPIGTHLCRFASRLAARIVASPGPARAGAFRKLLAVAFCYAALPVAHAADLMQIYRAAQENDPVLASARANWQATQELLPQARANLLPFVSGVANANRANTYSNLHTDPSVETHENYPAINYTISASQPLYRKQNLVALEQARSQVGQADFVLGSTQQDLVIRVAQAYFDVLLARFTIELTVSQKAAVSEQLAQAKRNFEVGVATITDTNEAQAKYDQVIAQEIAVRNDYDNKVAALRAIIGRVPDELRGFNRRFTTTTPVPDVLDAWISRAITDNLAVRIAQSNFEIAQLDVERARAGHYPTLDLVASFGQGYTGATTGSIQTANALSTRSAVIGVQLAVPLYQGGAVESRVRQAIAVQERARQDLETNRRNAQLQAQTSFSGVNNGAAQVRAFEQAVRSAQVSYESNRLGMEVGVRTNLDVLTTQQLVYQTQHDLAQAYYSYLLSQLRLKQAVGTLTDADLEEINRELSG